MGLPLTSPCSLLQHLEHSLEELDLTSFGLMDTTLEEVFLKVSEEDQSLENSDAGTLQGVRPPSPGGLLRPSAAILTSSTLADIKESKKEAFPQPSPRLGPKPQANGHPLPGPARPTKAEVDLGNLLNCSDLAESQASLHSSSSSSAGSVRGEDGGAYSEFYGDYSPLFDNPQDPDNGSLQGLWQGKSLRGAGEGKVPQNL